MAASWGKAGMELMVGTGGGGVEAWAPLVALTVIVTMAVAMSPSASRAV